MCVFRVFQLPSGCEARLFIKFAAILFFLVKELALALNRKGGHGVQLMPGTAELFLLLFTDDVVLLSDTAVGLQNHLNAFAKRRGADRLKLNVNVSKTKIVVVRKAGYLAARENW